LFIILWAINTNTYYSKNAKKISKIPWQYGQQAIYEINYNIIALNSGMTMAYLMKPLLAKSRPYFDDVSLGDTQINDCSAEFGNPSGHSISTAQFVFNMLWHYEEIYRLFFL